MTAPSPISKPSKANSLPRHASLPLAVSIGDPCGIGPDIILKAWNQQSAKLPAFFVIGSTDILKARAKQLNLEVLFSSTSEARPSSDHLVVQDLKSFAKGKPASPTTEDAQLIIDAIKQGVEHVQAGTAAALVTCPINKKTLYDVGFQHPGHTEFLAELATPTDGETPMPVMMLAGPELRTVPVTIHIPLDAVPSQLTTEMILKTCRIVDRDLKQRFNITTPRLALAGLNPHAGENGALGAEERAIIAPAVHQLQAEGLSVVGPLPADTMFHATARAAYDAAICMYHDQALIPAKMLGFDDAVNVTLGLPFIRTSPDHGTAYDIAGSGKANPSSFIAALRLAAHMTQETHTLESQS